MAFLLFAGTVEATQFKITKVIELVSGASTSPVGSTLKWAEDGSKVAYWNGGTLMLCDTLGQLDSIYTLTDSPSQWEWLSPREIIVHTYSYQRLSQDHRLVKIDIEEQTAIELRKYHWKALLKGVDTLLVKQSPDKDPRIFKYDQVPFDGPFSTINDNVHIVNDPDNIFNKYKRELIQSPYAKHNIDTSKAFVSFGEDAVYFVNLAKTDSVRVSKQRYTPYMGVLPMFVRKDGQYLSTRGTIVHLPTDVSVKLDTLITTLPLRTTGCDYHSEGFNPIFNEVLLTRQCDDGISYAVASIVIFNLETNTYQELTEIPGAFAVGGRRFAPDGLKISYVANGKLYLILREAL